MRCLPPSPPGRSTRLTPIVLRLLSGLLCLTLFGLTTVCVPHIHAADQPAADAAGIEHFEKHVRPVLAEHCYKCHGPEKQFAELRLDSRAAMLTGGDTGPALVPGDLKKSLLIDAIRYGDIQMPPDGPLSAAQVMAIEHWVQMGAPWPAEQLASNKADASRHWAFQPIGNPAVPSVQNQAWPITEIDRFILHKLEAEGLGPSPEATPREQVRRLFYDLTGLPPTYEDVAAFEKDPSPEAYDKLVDRLLASPQYGQHWGRKWLDVARYSDTKGYVYGREEKQFLHAATYRNWVVQALNDNMPYDQFIKAQLAADQLAPEHLEAMGYLTVGRRFLGVIPDIMDDRIDVVTRGLLGLTVSCARCHDHKYDPIPAADYYSLYGVLVNSPEKIVQVRMPEQTDQAWRDFEAGLEMRLRTLKNQSAILRGRTADLVRARITDYLVSVTNIDEVPDENFDLIIAENDLVPGLIRRWEAYLSHPDRQTDRVFAPWAQFAALKPDEFASRSQQIADALKGADGDWIHPAVRDLFATPPANMKEVAERYGQLLSNFDKDWRNRWKASEPLKLSSVLQGLNDPDQQLLIDVLYGPGSPCVLPNEHVSSIERQCNSSVCDALWAQQNDVDRWIINSNYSTLFATTLTERERLTDQRIFRRGNPSQPGQYTPRQFLKALSADDRKPFTDGSGRKELALEIARADNPLTSRVFVNRVWSHHFGAGLVRTPSDFGVRAEAPSHPELLDWLARRFTSSGWNIKALHRDIVRSRAYRQTSAPSADDPRLAKVDQVDPQNRWLWRMNARRLSFEELRDTWLSFGGTLSLATGGKTAELFPMENSPHRRSLYVFVDRQFVPGVLTLFDVANPDMHSPQRNETTVPQQALFTLNHPFIASRARDIAKRVPESTPAAELKELYRSIYQREPTDQQLQTGLAFLGSVSEEAQPKAPPTSVDWQYGYGPIDPEKKQLTGFTKLPHFTGTAWQGGPNWPDKDLGWVQVTADGGHPGNTLAHSGIRRWTAPRDMTISIQSKATHTHAVGDGVRCWIISSRSGSLASEVVHNTSRQMDVPSLEVKQGETIDFVVDIYQNLNTDDHLWSPVITEVVSPSGSSTSGTRWDAIVDFNATPLQLLSPKEQLVQVLLMTNEVMFVD